MVQLFVALLIGAPVWNGPAVVACINPPGPGQVTLWTGPNFDGACNTIGLDETAPAFPRPGSPERADFPNSAAFGLPNDSIQSIRVGPGVRAILFEHADLGGHPALFESGTSHSFAGRGAASLGPGQEICVSPTLCVPDPKTSSIKLIKSTAPIPYLFLGNFPRNFESSLGWTSETQGLCHTRTHWYITTRSSLWQVPLGSSLEAGTGFRRVRIPRELQGGFDHMGDPACLTRPDTGEEYVMVPLEARRKLILPRAAIFKPVATNVDPIFVNSDEFFISQDKSAAWVAFDSGTTDEVWTSGSNLPKDGIQIYKIFWPNIENGLFFFDQGPDTTRPGPTLTNKRGNPLDISVTQGGVFSGDGSLFFLSNGSSGTGGIWVFDRNGIYAGESGNGYGPFNFEISCCLQEPEGMDWFPTSDSITPGISGQLHVLLLNNETGPLRDDKVFLKHYAVPAEVTVYVGYLNNLTAPPNAADVPSPFDSDTTTQLISSGGVKAQHDTGVIRFENLTDAAVTIDRGLHVRTEQNVFQIWDDFLPVVLDPGKSLVLAETINFNFDTSDFGLGIDPIVTGSVNGIPFSFTDSARVLLGHEDAVGSSETTRYQVLGRIPRAAWHLWVAMLTQNTNSSGTNSPIALTVNQDRTKKLEHVFPDTPQDDQQQGQANLYEVNVTANAIDADKFDNTEWQVTIGGNDAWHPEHFVLWGERPDGALIPIAMETDLRIVLSTNPREGQPSFPLRRVGQGGDDMSIKRLLLLMTTANVEDAETQSRIKLQISSGGRLVVDYEIPNTPQREQERAQANLYFVPVPGRTIFTRNSLDDTSISLSILGADMWLPASLFLFGVDNDLGRPAHLVPLVHIPTWNLGTLSTASNEGEAFVNLPLQ